MLGNNQQSLQPDTLLHSPMYTYRIEKVLGQGSFGITYLATTKVKMRGPLGELETEITVAIKEYYLREVCSRDADGSVSQSGESSLARRYGEKFRKEAVNLSRLHHPNIVKVLEVFDANATHYYVMEYVEGCSLDDYIKQQGRLPSLQVTAWTKEIGAAVSYMHSQKMLHLDLKPLNVMCRKDGHLVLIDFGLAKQYDEAGEPESSTKVGGGTPGYSPIEQANYKDGKDFPVTMDVYALGGTMYKMLTGARPPSSSDILNEGFPYSALEEVDANRQLIKIVAKAMSPVKKDRYQSVDELLEACKRIEGNRRNVPLDDGYRKKPDETTYVTAEEKPRVGYYKKKIGEAEYGTAEIVKVPVKNPIKMPDDSIYIDLWNNDRKGQSLEICLNVGDCNTVSYFQDGEKTGSDNFGGGIYPDVRAYLVDNGFLAPEHWECEESTTPTEDDFGTDVFIEFNYKDGTKFVRNVEHAHKAWHHLLLDAVEGLLKETSLREFVYSNKKEDTRPFEMQEKQELDFRQDLTEIKVAYSPQTPILTGTYIVTISPNQISFNQERSHAISKSQFLQIVDDLRSEHFQVTSNNVRSFDAMEYSESPTSLQIWLSNRTGVYVYYEREEISGKHYGNLLGEVNYINKRIQNIVPGLQEYLKSLYAKEK